MAYDGTLKFDTSIDTTGFQSGLSKISSVASTAVKTTAAVLATATTAVAGIGTAAIKVGTEFESQMSRVQAISGATGDDFEALKAQAVELGAETAFSAQEAAEGMENLASAGFTTSEIMEAMPGMLDLAASSGEDLASSADIAASTLRGFGLEASEASHVADVLAKNAADTNAAIADTGEAMKYIAPVAHNMGLSLEEVTAAIGLMANAGIQGSQAGTTLRSALSRLAKPTSTMQETMDELGISFYDSEGKMKSLTEIIAMLQDSMAGLTDEEKQNALVTLFGQESLSGMMALMDAGSDELAEMTAAYEDCDGAAQEMAETMQNNLASQVEQFTGSLESLGIAVYEDVKTPLTETMKTINDFSDSLLTAFNENGFEGLADQFGTVIVELGEMAADAVPDLVESGVDCVEAFIGSIMDNSDEFAQAGADIVASVVSGIFEVVGDMYSSGIELFRKFLEGLSDDGNAEEMGRAAADMVGDIADAIVENLPLIIQAAKDLIEGFCDGLEEQFPGASALFEGFLEGFVGTAGTIIQGIVDVLEDLFGVINDADPATLEAVGYAIGVIAASIAALKVASNVVSGVSSLFSVLGSVKTNITGVIGVVKNIVSAFSLWSGGAGTLAECIGLYFPKIGTLISGVGKVITTVGTTFSKIVTTVGSGLSKVASFIAANASTIAGIGSIIAGVALAVTNFVDMFVNGFSAIKEVLMVVGIALAAVGAVLLGAPIAIAAAVAGIIAGVATLVILIKDNWNAIVEFFQGIPEKIGEVVNAIVEWFASLPEKAGEFLDSVVEFFTGLPDRIIEGISTLAEKFVEWGSSMLETATTVVTEIIDSIVQFFTDLPYKIGYAIGFAIGTLASWALDVINWIATNVPIFIDNIVTFFSELPGKIWEWLCDTVEKIGEWGEDVLEWIEENVPGMIDDIVEYFSELPGNIWEWLQQTIQKIAEWGSQMLQQAKQAGQNFLNSVITFFRQLPGNVWTWLSNTVQRVAQWAVQLAQQGAQAALSLVNAVINGVKNLPSQMLQVGYNIVTGVWQGIQNAARWFANSVKSFFSGIVDGVKSALGISSPSKVFAEEVGEWIPPGVGEGVSDAMPDLYRQMDDEMSSLGKRMQAAVNVETGKIAVDKNVNTTYKVEKEKSGVFEAGDTNVDISGETHVHVELDGKEVGNATTPIVDKNMGRIDTHKKRGG